MRQIVSFGGGGFSMESGNPLLDEFVLDLTGKARARRSASCPRPAVTPTTTWSASIATFRRRAASPSHVSLFRRERAPVEPREHLLSQDLIYVGGGSVTSLLGVWRAHGIDRDPARVLGAPASSSAGSRRARCAGSPRAISTFHGPARADRGARLPALDQHRPLLERARPARGAVRRAARRDVAGLRRRRRRGAAFRRRRRRPGGRLAAERPRLSGRAPPWPRGHDPARDPLPRRRGVRAAGPPAGAGRAPSRCWSPRERVGARRLAGAAALAHDPRPGRARVHAQARQRGDPRLHAGARRRGRAARLPAADREWRPGGADRGLPRRVSDARRAGSRTCRCSGSRPSRSTSSGICSPRT